MQSTHTFQYPKVTPVAAAPKPAGSPTVATPPRPAR
jgi:hypothetical protein